MATKRNESPLRGFGGGCIDGSARDGAKWEALAELRIWREANLRVLIRCERGKIFFSGDMKCGAREGGRVGGRVGGRGVK